MGKFFGKDLFKKNNSKATGPFDTLEDFSIAYMAIYQLEIKDEESAKKRALLEQEIVRNNKRFVWNFVNDTCGDVDKLAKSMSRGILFDLFRAAHNMAWAYCYVFKDAALLKLVRKTTSKIGLLTELYQSLDEGGEYAWAMSWGGG